ncbi:hypothetical protein VPY20_001393 [Campylobacter jejuni]|nr:hypothetical protein [Campylobacter jejuni]HEC1695969.1 hypothetical protein [Campylobacter jejuni]
MKKIIAVRKDGLGERMCAFLNAMVIAKNLKLKFEFTWNLGLSRDIYAEKLDLFTPQSCMPNIKEIFDDEFIQKYYAFNFQDINHEDFPDISELKNCKIKSWLDFARYEWGDIFYSQMYLSEFFDYDLKSYKKDLQLAWTNIKFSQKYQFIIDNINNIYQKFGNFIAIHIRSADIVYGKCGDTVYVSHLKMICFHLAASMIKYFKDTQNCNKFLVFADDCKSTRDLKKQCLSQNINIFTVEDFNFVNELNSSERTFFEVLLMSKADKIYSTRFSGFSRLANFISAGEDCGIYQSFTVEQLFNMLYNGVRQFQFNDEQTATSYFMLYIYSSWLNRDSKEQEFFLQNATFLYKECFLFKLFYIYILLKNNNFKILKLFLDNLNNKELEKIKSLILSNQEILSLYGFMYFYFVRYHDKHRFLFEISIEICIKIIKGEYLCNNEMEEAVALFIFKKNNLKLSRSNLNFSAIELVKNHLSYKLGQAIVENSKSILGLIRMPYVLSYISDKHKQEQKYKKDLSLKLSCFKNYPDYQEALKYKECFAYKLGEALIKAHRSWYKGGYIRLIFNIIKLKKEFKNKGKK